jgi:HAD superfamily hydrolase (TIGR01549 family)
VLQHAGVTQGPATDAALAELREYHRHDNLWEHVEADVAPALAALRQRGLRLVVVSNANGRLRHLFDRLDLAKWFDLLFDSHDWGVEKPDPRLFQLALEQSRSDPARTVHVGDLYHVDVMGARRAGLREGVLFDVGGLYDSVDCPRVASFAELVAWIDTPSGNQTRNRVP